MYRLEHGIKDKKIIDLSKPHISQLQNLNQEQWSDPYSKSQLLRKQFRTEKKKLKAEFDATETIRDKHSLQIELLPEIPSDIIGAKTVNYNASHVLEKKKLETTAVQPLFASRKKKDDSGKELNNLRHIAKVHTRLKTDPFYQPNPFTPKVSPTNTITVKPNTIIRKKKKIIRNNDESPSNSISTLVSYTDSESD